MNKVLKDVLKNGAIMFVVGAVLAMIAPTMGDMIGIEGIRGSHTASSAWMGSFFGAFGALHAAATPLFNAVFGDKKEELAKSDDDKTLVHIQITSPEMEQAQTVQKSNYRETLAAERAAPAQSKIITL